MNFDVAKLLNKKSDIKDDKTKRFIEYYYYLRLFSSLFPSPVSSATAAGLRSLYSSMSPHSAAAAMASSAYPGLISTSTADFANG